MIYDVAIENDVYAHEKPLNTFKVTTLKANVVLLLNLNKLLFHPCILTQSILMHCLLLLAGPQYGSLERAWLAVMTEAEKVSELHQEVKNNLLNEDLEKVKNWQKDAYHKQMMGGFKETKEADEGFRKAQKPWAKKLKEVRRQIFSHKSFFGTHFQLMIADLHSSKRALSFFHLKT